MNAPLSQLSGTLFVCLSLMFLAYLLLDNWYRQRQRRKTVRALLDLWERPDLVAAQREIIEAQLAEIHRQVRRDEKP